MADYRDISEPTTRWHDLLEESGRIQVAVLTSSVWQIRTEMSASVREMTGICQQPDSENSLAWGRQRRHQHTPEVGIDHVPFLITHLGRASAALRAFELSVRTADARQ
jgi:hypothetical protein